MYISISLGRVDCFFSTGFNELENQHLRSWELLKILGALGRQSYQIQQQNFKKRIQNLPELQYVRVRHLLLYGWLQFFHEIAIILTHSRTKSWTGSVHLNIIEFFSSSDYSNGESEKRSVNIIFQAQCSIPKVIEKQTITPFSKFFATARVW